MTQQTLEELEKLNSGLASLHRTLEAIRVELAKLNMQVEEISKIVDRAIDKYKQFSFKMWLLFIALIAAYIVAKLLL